jgi:hypothetical protein
VGVQQVREQPHGGVGLRHLPGRQHVEKQAAADREGQPGRGPGRRRGCTARLQQRGGRVDPVRHDAVEQRGRPRPALQRLAVDLEEQSLLCGQFRAPQVLPETERGVLGHRLRVEGVQRRPLPFLDLTDDRDEQRIARAEMVDEHAVAGARRFRDGAQAQARDPARQRHLDHRLEEFLAGGRGWLPGTCVRHVPHGTSLVWSNW